MKRPAHRDSRSRLAATPATARAAGQSAPRLLRLLLHAAAAGSGQQHRRHHEHHGGRGHLILLQQRLEKRAMAAVELPLIPAAERAVGPA